MNASQCNVLLSDKNMFVCVSRAELTQPSQPFLSSRLSERLPCQRHGWMGACLFLSLSLHLPPLPILSLFLPCEHRGLCFVLPSPPRSPSKRESPSHHRHRERRPRDTNRTWHPERGLRWRRKNVFSPSLSSLPHCLVSLCRLPSEGLRLQSGGEESGTDIEFVTLSDSWWRHLKEEYDLNSVIYVIMT